ncbi:uncharacterized protein LOC115532199 [Gadus morhua]|uniref:Glycosyltransferase family 92 protein n=1 Tax=Gadus morhua TaxID=8049 RepID=A0A8C5FM99_GADMO|nr:uncharacterized protein LOC115532199 [Gadus morhua]
MLPWRPLGRVFLVASPLMGVIMLALALHQRSQLDRRATRHGNHISDQQAANWCGFRVQSDAFTRVAGSKTLLINAFREHRTANASVRLIAIVPQAERALSGRCVFCCRERGEVVTVEAKRTTHPSNYFFSYGTGDFLCPMPSGCQPRYVGLVSEDGKDLSDLTLLPVLNRRAPERSRMPLNFTLCMPSLFNHYDNVLQFVQAMELYQLLGIQKAFLYKTSCSATMETVLQYYSGKVGFLQVLPWPISSHLKPSSSWLPSTSPGDIHYYGQIPANNDCLYRNMHQSRYVLMHDPDEVIVPTGNVSFQTLMSDLEKAHGENVNFYFPNNIFRLEEKEENSKYDLLEWKHLPGTNFLLHTLRETDGAGGKLVLDPRSVLQMEVHAVQAHFNKGRTETIGSEQGLLHHVRRRKNSQQKSDLVREEGLLKMAPALVQRVNRALSSMGLLNTSFGPAPH